ncbi:DUF488 domain-containing protein [Ammoniphilus resinae]|uniref:Uncharacterized protein YeaO (DUF488 family) n=1 Tax=Ammoniphilus resinae TaxID=861532 RepID=A0ABS4GWE7_9BACL|nr:DUF488 family protein [Ammoniphilus resinae]MBP1934593.1 uncharacterized protein YeaO (DUF488 family) [Ammoniphilus resinae]
MEKSQIEIKRIYDPPSERDGKRILVDRLWPRGVKKEQAHLDVWLKDIAPNPDLRLWFGHDRERYGEFRIRYLDELATNPIKREMVKQLLDDAKIQPVTLLFAAKDVEFNHAVVLREMLIDLAKTQEESNDCRA